MKLYERTSDVGNIFVVSENSHPAGLVQADIEMRIKDDTKVFLITSEGENEYTKHCEGLQGKQESISDVDKDSLKNQYNIFEITDNDRLQSDFADKLYNALNVIWEDIQAAKGKKAIYFNNIYMFFDSKYQSSDCIELLVRIFKEAIRYDCSIIVFNWKSVDFTQQYNYNNTDYTSNIFNNVNTYIITAIQDYKNIRIVSDVFHLTEKEENLLRLLKSNEGMCISDKGYDLISWEK
ncbi:MAG: hypothetical protein HFE49_05350 [Clostridia bacterium]|nr:hypothetical protein [Clostridia bacterium]